ncbi:uncharacterized protein B0P05DRAFT_579514 [Gilbertella persicaria]|uniref:uncharacterized protein n=1 Tax=Gilbertella persicaria TaxID=101096 RepID=UPI00221EC8AF|nr:uncharacterized protein B0P05DRAFT_579514 [Gilbertella persicaria]KAI8078275.1 hypothetical protein B0P05DRAFT_579514 [Gilbertella persicaria]
MKFTPIIDRHAALHDASKKVHVTFDDEPTETTVPLKKRSHPAHDNDREKKKSKSSEKTKKNKKEKAIQDKEVKTTEKAPEKIEPTKPLSAVPINTPTSNEPPKVRGPKFTPKKVKGKKQPPKKLTEEEILAKVAAKRKKNALKRQAKVKVNGELVSRPAFHIIPTSLTQVIPTKQLGEFVLYALSETTNLAWCSIIHKAKVERLVMVFAQGLNCTDFGISNPSSPAPFVDLDQLDSTQWVGKASMPFLTKQSKYMIVNQISGHNGRFNSPVADILQCNMSNTKKEKLANEQSVKGNKFKDNMREYYVLSLEEMKKADYPIPPFLDSSVCLPEGWKETHASTEPLAPGQPKRIIAVDCEMVLTVRGSALARITLIDEDGSVLLDDMVKPDQPIIDYLTKYSGITPAAMSTATCSLRRAQKHVRKFVNHNVILVGHGLENDLKALQLAHPYCVDTSLIYDHHKGPPYKPSLRFLARNYLKRRIQDRNETRVGHDSAEDARATLDLFKLKLANKISFGKYKKTELIMDRLLANRPSRTSAILEASQSEQRSFGATHGGDYYRVDTNEALVELTLEKIKEKNFLFTRYQSMHQKDQDAVPGIVPSAAASTQSKRALQLQQMDDYIRRIYHGLEQNSFLVVSGGVCDVPEYKT